MMIAVFLKLFFYFVTLVVDNNYRHVSDCCVECVGLTAELVLGTATSSHTPRKYVKEWPRMRIKNFSRKHRGLVVHV